MELRLLTAQQCRDNVDENKIILVEIMAKYLKCTYLCPILVAFPAAPYLLQATWEMWVSGAAILTTAAALLSREDEDAKKVMAEHDG
jgi:hypothetical protein